MLNKKAGIAAEEIRGILTFMFVAVIALLIFYSCSVNKAAKEYKELKISKEEIESYKALNFFLEMPVDEERKVSDVVAESYLNNNYEAMNKLVVDHFGELKDSAIHSAYDYWVLQVWDDSVKYNSINFNRYETRFCTAGGGSETYIPARDKDLKLSWLKVTLFITQKCN